MGLASFNRMRRMNKMNYESMSLEQLKQQAKDKGIAGYYNMKRETLLEKLKG